jgi:hypothetical protein
MKELELPSEASTRSDAAEFLRAWAYSDDRVEFVSRGNVFPDAGYIGIFLADLLRHFVSSSEASQEIKEQQTRRAVAAFNAELV